jgi:hypothetical protein
MGRGKCKSGKSPQCKKFTTQPVCDACLAFIRELEMIALTQDTPTTPEKPAGPIGERYGPTCDEDGADETYYVAKLIEEGGKLRVGGIGLLEMEELQVEPMSGEVRALWPKDCHIGILDHNHWVLTVLASHGWRVAASSQRVNTTMGGGTTNASGTMSFKQHSTLQKEYVLEKKKKRYAE